MLTLRLDTQLEQTINTLSHQMGISKSELIRKSVIAFIERLDKPSPWDLGVDLFGNYASGQDNLSTDRKVLIQENLNSKYKK